MGRQAARQPHAVSTWQLNAGVLCAGAGRQRAESTCCMFDGCIADKTRLRTCLAAVHLLPPPHMHAPAQGRLHTWQGWPRAARAARRRLLRRRRCGCCMLHVLLHVSSLALHAGHVLHCAAAVHAGRRPQQRACCHDLGSRLLLLLSALHRELGGADQQHEDAWCSAVRPLPVCAVPVWHDAPHRWWRQHCI